MKDVKRNFKVKEGVIFIEEEKERVLWMRNLKIMVIGRLSNKEKLSDKTLLIKLRRD